MYVDTRFETRRRALASELASRRLDALLVTDLVNIYYLTGFSGSNAALLAGKDRSAAMATDGRYTTQIAAEVPDIKATIARACDSALLSASEGFERIAIEADKVTLAQFEALKEAVGEKAELVPVTGVVEELRLIKDDEEIEDLARVAELATEALRQLLAAGELAAGRTEREVAADLEYRMRRLGADRTSFDTIVASGPNSAKPHHGAGERIIENGDIVTIDFGAYLAGYNSDTTRTFVIGYADEFSAEIYNTILRAQLAGIEVARPGVELKKVDEVCRSIIAEAGFEPYFTHSTGHGVGLDVHEAPSASTSGTGSLKPGMTLTIEPGIYVPGRGGVRIEDTLVITEGAPRIITAGITKDMTVV